MLKLAIGVVIGIAIGIVITAIAASSSWADDRMEELMRE